MIEASAADRAHRALAGLVDQARPRVDGDGDDPGIPVAATVVLVREGRAGPEVLLIERPDRGSFAGAWVFPGGKVDDVDRTGGVSEADAARRAAVRETTEEVGLVLGPDSLQPLSVWDPPPGIPLRIRTWFFLAPDPGGRLSLQPDEAVAAEWTAPADVLARHAAGLLTLYPPTWVTLRGLVGAASVDDLLSTARIAGLRRFETVARRGPDGPMLVWPEDAEYAGASEGSARHRLNVSSLPWTYHRND